MNYTAVFSVSNEICLFSIMGNDGKGYQMGWQAFPSSSSAACLEQMY